jgi:hypothetical protein
MLTICAECRDATARRDPFCSCQKRLIGFGGGGDSSCQGRTVAGSRSELVQPGGRMRGMIVPDDRSTMTIRPSGDDIAL